MVMLLCSVLLLSILSHGAALTEDFDSILREATLSGTGTCSTESPRCAQGNDDVSSGCQVIKGTAPWVVAVQSKSPSGDSAVCTGTLISTAHVLTSGGCVLLGKAEETTVLAGVTDLHDSTAKRMAVGDIIQSTDPHNNLRILTLVRDITITANVRPVCLVDHEEENVNINGTLNIFSWAALPTGNMTRFLRKFHLDSDTCTRESRGLVCPELPFRYLGEDFVVSTEIKGNPFLVRTTMLGNAGRGLLCIFICICIGICIGI